LFKEFTFLNINGANCPTWISRVLIAADFRCRGDIQTVHTSFLPLIKYREEPILFLVPSAAWVDVDCFTAVFDQALIKFTMDFFPKKNAKHSLLKFMSPTCSFAEA